MSRVNRPGSITDVIKLLNDNSSTSATHDKGKVTDNSSEQPASSKKEKTVAHLRSDIIRSIKALSLDDPEQKESARKILISKIIHWHFDSLIRNSAQKAYLTETVNKSIKADESANEQLEQLLMSLSK